MDAETVKRARHYVASSMHDRDKSWGDLVLAGERDDCPEMRKVLKAIREERAMLARPTVDAPAGVSGLAAELKALADKAFHPNSIDFYLPWRVEADSGKPTIVGNRSGNLFRGYIGTWQDADLVVALVNNLPAILSALSQPQGETGELVERLIAGEVFNELVSKLDPAHLPQARAIADALCDEIADYDPRDPDDATAWMYARNGAWAALSAAPAKDAEIPSFEALYDAKQIAVRDAEIERLRERVKALEEGVRKIAGPIHTTNSWWQSCRRLEDIARALLDGGSDA